MSLALGTTKINRIGCYADVTAVKTSAWRPHTRKSVSESYTWLAAMAAAVGLSS
jgi:hypothetical protein